MPKIAGGYSFRAMPDLLATLGVAVLVFASTNVDDILLLAAFFADPHLTPRTVAAGQFLGIGTLVLASAVPSALGLPKLWRLWTERRRMTTGGATEREEADEAAGLEAEHRAEGRGRSQLLAVAAMTLANGGDNLGVYIPLVASAPRTIPVYVAVCAGMTALRCLAGLRAGQQPGGGAPRPAARPPRAPLRARRPRPLDPRGRARSVLIIS
jgi:cadmium resistance protein CadD (predicted permease)